VSYEHNWLLRFPLIMIANMNFRLREGEQVLRKKGRGCLIHVSDFIEEVNRRLVSLTPDGKVHHDAHKVIYPGSNGDPYWDCDQLVKQVVDSAIPIFEEAHPGCQALFVFDQSSAHAALPPDALKASEMNKSNGGKQLFQKDTIIPKTNPYPEYRGKIQKMTTENGQQKGLQQTLEERGFDVKNMRAKCAPVCPYENSAAWPAFSVSKMILLIKSPCSKLQLRRLATSASSFPSFIAN
jgi:hypothetical protein